MFLKCLLQIKVTLRGMDCNISVLFGNTVNSYFSMKSHLSNKKMFVCFSEDKNKNLRNKKKIGPSKINKY